LNKNQPKANLIFRIICMTSILVFLPIACGPSSRKTNLDWWCGEWAQECAGPEEKYWITFQAEGQKLRFKMEAFSGAHQGLIEGVAVLTGDLAVFEERQDWNDEGTARVTFKRSGESIVVISTNTSGYGGMGISFAKGTYWRGPPKENSFPLSQGPRPLMTTDEEMRLKQLVTLDYPLFVANLHLANAETVNSSDFQGQKIDGFVRGMANERAAMILIDKQGHMAAAVTDHESGEVRLYNEISGKQIPPLLRQWKDSNPFASYRWVIK